MLRYIGRAAGWNSRRNALRRGWLSRRKQLASELHALGAGVVSRHYIHATLWPPSAPVKIGDEVQISIRGRGARFQCSSPRASLASTPAPARLRRSVVSFCTSLWPLLDHPPTFLYLQRRHPRRLVRSWIRAHRSPAGALFAWRTWENGLQDNMADLLLPCSAQDGYDEARGAEDEDAGELPRPSWHRASQYAVHQACRDR